MFNKTDEICSVQKQNYKVLFEIKLNGETITVITTVVDTGV